MRTTHHNDLSGACTSQLVQSRRLSGRAAVRDFARAFRAAFPDLAFGGTADLIAEGDYVVGQWIGGGTHTGAPLTDLPLGGLPEANTGKTMRFTGTTVLKALIATTRL